MSSRSIQTMFSADPYSGSAICEDKMLCLCRADRGGLPLDKHVTSLARHGAYAPTCDGIKSGIVNPASETQPLQIG